MAVPVTAPSAQDVEAVWAEVGASLKAFVRRRVADPHEAEDVVADVVLRIQRHLRDLDDRERVTAWVFRIARNAITDHYRHSARSLELLVEVEPPAAPPADEWLEDQAAVATELASCIRPLIEALPAGDRRALELTDLQGRTQAEAARLEGLSVSGMKSRVQRGRRRFAALVSSCCEVDTDGRGGIVDFRLRTDGPGCDPSRLVRRAASKVAGTTGAAPRGAGGLEPVVGFEPTA